jgi:hypothetical protein
MRKFGKPQKGNPHRLVIGQHTFPSTSIARFADADGRVHVHLKPAGAIWRAKPIDIIFCARRAWDHGTDVGFMKTIEDRFQQLADLIIDGRVLNFDAEQRHVISSFYALWMVRAEIRDPPGKDAILHGVLPARGAWSKDEEEGLEKAGLAFVRRTTIPAHVVNGARARVLVGRYLRQVNPSASWGVIRASGGEFVVPDWPVQAFIPINPTLALANPAINQTLDRDAIGAVNKQLRMASRRYFFARDLAACP